MRVEHQSNRSNHLTPDNILDRVRLMDSIGLDPASCQGNPTGARVHLTPKRDGLNRTWNDSGLVFVNPPYARGKAGCGPWVQKAVIESIGGAEIIMLLPARTDTRFFRLVFENASCLCFVRGRLTFKGEDNGAPFPSAVVYFGPRPKTFRQSFEDIGHVIDL